MIVINPGKKDVLQSWKYSCISAADTVLHRGQEMGVAHVYRRRNISFHAREEAYPGKSSVILGDPFIRLAAAVAGHLSSSISYRSL